MEFKDYYATLGVARDASAKDIKQAYRKLARKLHPDVNPGDKSAETRFKAINEAYEVLGDQDKRRKYDELGANWRQYEQAQRQGGASPFDSAGWGFNAGGGQGGGFRTMSEDEMRRIFGDEDPFSDFFHAFFGGQPGGGAHQARSRRARRGRDVEQHVELTLEEAYAGVTRRLMVKQEGHTRSLDVRIPAGVADGARVRVAGEGEHGSSGGPAGDLYLRVHIAAHGRFERTDRDLRASIPVEVTTAVLGGEAELRSLAGTPLRIKIPPGTQNGQVFRLKGHGMPVPGRPEDRGDLFAKVDIRLPRHLTPEQQRHYEALAQLENSTGPESEQQS